MEAFSVRSRHGGVVGGDEIVGAQAPRVSLFAGESLSPVTVAPRAFAIFTPHVAEAAEAHDADLVTPFTPWSRSGK